MRGNFAQGNFEIGQEASPASIARVYCQTVVRDIHKRRELELKYPGKIFTLIYDKFVRDPVNNLRALHRFLDIPLNSSNADAVKKLNKAQMAIKWKGTMPVVALNAIEKECKDLGFIWKW